MHRYCYDLHIHSCLSPCADDDASPANIAGMAALNGLQIAALTDHNSTRNCPAFFEAAHRAGVIPIAGMELTTAEDIHVVCLLPSLDAADEFQRTVDRHIVVVRNRPEIFGHQYIMDAEDTVIREEENLLINATSLTLEQAFDCCFDCGGVCYPAHIDRASNGILAVLGAFPELPVYTAYELHDAASAASLSQQFPQLSHMVRVVSSDAHELGAIAEAENCVMLEQAADPVQITRSLLEYLRH